MPPENNMNEPSTITSDQLDAALLRNNDYIVEKISKNMGEQITILRNQVGQHNKEVLDKLVNLAVQAGENRANIANNKSAIAVHDEMFKSIKVQFAVIVTVSTTAGGFIGFLLSNLFGG